jgi:hypothetical protein
MRMVVRALARRAVRMELAGVASLIRAADGICRADSHQSHRSGEGRYLSDAVEHHSPPFLAEALVLQSKPAKGRPRIAFSTPYPNIRPETRFAAILIKSGRHT